jgi:hypothetical protein
MLELIASKKCPVSSLWIRDAFKVTMDCDRFENLNFDSLECLSPNNLSDYDIEYLLDLILESKCKDLTLELTENVIPPDDEVFNHPLMQRVDKVVFHTRK